MKGIVSTPNLKLKKIIKKNFKVYDLDEYNTSKINCYTLKENKNLWLPDRLEKSRKLHSVLTYKMDNKRLGCINRDENAVNNMITIVNEFIKFKKRPEVFTRKDEKEQTVGNLNLTSITNISSCEFSDIIV